MKFYVIAGEASGDMHGANLMKALLEQDTKTEFQFWGGDKMAQLSDGLVKHIRDLAFMGFFEVLMNIRTIAKNFRFCKEDILNYKPDALILIDYPGFNLRIAEWAKDNGIKVYYYISPQVWAWKQSRVHKIKKFVDKMYVILPFEKDFYKQFDYDVEYVGHPLLDEIESFKEQRALSSVEFRSKYNLSERPIIAVLPGSRNQEIKMKLPIMLKALGDYRKYQVVVAGAPTQTIEYYQQFVKNGVRVVKNDTYNLLNNSAFAVVTSGTATLETALFKVPEVVCYKGSSLSYQIAKRLVKIDYISLVNLIAGKEVVKELIQNECTPENIQKELDLLIEDSEYREKMLKEYNNLDSLLGKGGASEKVAQSLLKTIS